MSRLLAMILEESGRHWAGHRKRSIEISMAISKSLNDIDSLNQQITRLAVATNDLANANSNRTALEAEIAKERQRFEALKKKMTDLGQQSALESAPEKSPSQKALEQKYGLLQRQLWEVANTNTGMRNAKAELERWRSQLELAISTNAPLKEAKQKLESAHEESEDLSNRKQ